jgi:hypothetical protein
MATFSARMCWMLCRWLAPRIGTPHVDVLDRIVTGMALDEIEDLPSVVEGVRYFMRNKTNPVPPKKQWLLEGPKAGPSISWPNVL